MRSTASVQQVTTQPEWFVSWFDSPHYQRLYAHRNEAEARAFLDRLIARLQPGDGASVLDLGCGNGRHVSHLASRGFRVTGLDLSAESLAVAMTRPGATARWLQQDMRQPFGDEAYDYVLSLFTSVGYFDDPEDNLTVIGNIARSLTPGGRVVIDFLNVHHALAGLVPEEIVDGDGVRYRISRWSDADAIFKRVRVEGLERQPPLEFVERVSKLTTGDFRFMLAICGLHLERIYGDYSLGRFEPRTSPRLILVARKKDDVRRATGAPGFCGCGSRSRASCRDRTPASTAAPDGQSTDRRGGTPGTALPPSRSAS